MSEQLLYPSAALGYRCWLFTPPDELGSLLHFNGSWKPGTNTAQCVQGVNQKAVHSAPQDDCQCGLYAWHSLQAAERNIVHESIQSGMIEGSDALLVMGAVAARGRLEVHWNGFRAEQARILALWLNPAQMLMFSHKLEERYQVPIFQNRQAMEEYALQFAEPVPEEQRPDLHISVSAQQLIHERYPQASTQPQQAQLAREVGISLEDLHYLAPYFCTMEDLRAHDRQQQTWISF